MDRPRPPSCLQCLHYFVTYDVARPRGCRLFNIKTSGVPSYEVFAATGAFCPGWQKNPRLKASTQDPEAENA